MQSYTTVSVGYYHKPSLLVDHVRCRAFEKCAYKLEVYMQGYVVLQQLVLATYACMRQNLLLLLLISGLPIHSELRRYCPTVRIAFTSLPYETQPLSPMPVSCRRCDNDGHEFYLSIVVALRPTTHIARRF